MEIQLFKHPFAYLRAFSAKPGNSHCAFKDIAEIAGKISERHRLTGDIMELGIDQAVEISTKEIIDQADMAGMATGSAPVFPFMDSRPTQPVESLSAYARQFLDRMEKPDVEKIEGLSPAISIEQHTTSGNPRSIVATVTEIHDYLRILYGSLATPHCPNCGKPVTRQSAEQIVDAIIGLPDSLSGEAGLLGNQSSEADLPDSLSGEAGNLSPEVGRPGNLPAEADAPLKILLLAPVVKGKKGRHEEVFATLKRNGFARVKVDGEMYLLEEVPTLDKKKAHTIDVVVDRLILPSARLGVAASSARSGGASAVQDFCLTKLKVL